MYGNQLKEGEVIDGKAEEVDKGTE
jgi:hypothetical protein